MSESSALLHNMSTPPKTVLKYSGLVVRRTLSDLLGITSRRV